MKTRNSMNEFCVIAKFFAISSALALATVLTIMTVLPLLLTICSVCLIADEIRSSAGKIVLKKTFLAAVGLILMLFLANKVLNLGFFSHNLWTMSVFVFFLCHLYFLYKRDARDYRIPYRKAFTIFVDVFLLTVKNFIRMSLMYLFFGVSTLLFLFLLKENDMFYVPNNGTMYFGIFLISLIQAFLLIFPFKRE